jgi:hypothetical protein
VKPEREVQLIVRGVAIGIVRIQPIGAHILKHTYVAVLSLLFAAFVCRAQTPSSGQDQTNLPAQSIPPSDQTAPAAANPPGSNSGNQGQNKADQTGADAKANSKDRLFFALPNFLTVENAANIPPLTTKGKFSLVARSAFDPVQFVWYGALAGISQAENSEPGFGQGAEGYGKRYGAYFADGTIENFFVGAIFPSIFHQDPRFFQNGKGSFSHRTGYAVSRIFVTRTDSDRNEFNISEIFGSAVAATISTYSYHPHPGYHPQIGVDVPYIASDRTLRNTASVWGSQVGYDTITYVIKEFWPDIRRKIRRNHME